MRGNSLFVFLLLFTVAGAAQRPVPQLPQTYIDTSFAPPTGVTRPVHTSTDFKNALDAANQGDTIVLDAGSTYQGNFTLPAKSNPSNKWIYIVGSALSSLPAPGTRVNPANDVGKMPKIMTASTQSALILPPGSNHYRLVGIEVYSASTAGCGGQNCYSQSLVNGNSVPGRPLVDSIIVDRCYLHGSPTIDVRVGVVANGSNFAVIDSYISDIHQSTNDSQAVLAYYSPGPIKIVNNFLSATGEDVMFGGAGGLSNPWVPSDVEIRGNHFFKDPAWAAPGVTLPPNNKWAVKNNLEFKSARRVLVDSNLIENVWPSAQMGFSLMFTPRTNASGLLAVVDDITISNNVLKNVSSGFDTLESDDNCLQANGCTNPGEMKRVLLYNNLILLGDTTQPGYGSGYGYGGLIMHDLVDFVVQHNTIVPPPNLGYCKGSLYFNSTAPYTPPRSSTHNIWILDNVLCRQISGPRGMIGQTSNALSDYMGDPSPVAPRFVGNVFYAPRPDSVYPLPLHNYTSTLPFVYVSQSAGNYQISVPAWTDTSDGKISGANSSALATPILPLPKNASTASVTFVNTGVTTNTGNGNVSGANSSAASGTVLTGANKPLH